MRLPCVFRTLLLLPIACGAALPQAVISARSGILNYSEGSILLDDQPLGQKFGTFPAIKEGSVLSTEKGRAEVLLTPGVFLRIDERSAIRMVSGALSDTRVEFLRGSVILDSNDASSSNPILLTFKTFQLRFPKNGVYRIDSDPAVFETYTGEAQITDTGQPPVTIDDSHQFFFGIGMQTRKYGEGSVDSFSEWARSRAETITADNRAANQSIADQNSTDPSASDGSIFGNSAPLPSVGVSNLPSYGTYGTFGGPVVVDNGLLGYYNPLLASPFSYPTTLIYVVPRWYRRNPVAPWQPHRAGYPTLPPTHLSYPHPSPIHPITPPMRLGYANSQAHRMAVPAARPVAPIAAPRPMAVRPMAVPHR
jgi:hypothetical protein